MFLHLKLAQCLAPSFTGIPQASNVNLYQQSEMEEGATTGGSGPKLTKTDLGKLPRVNVVFDAQARHYGVL